MWILPRGRRQRNCSKLPPSPPHPSPYFTIILFLFCFSYVTDSIRYYYRTEWKFEILTRWKGLGNRSIGRSPPPPPPCRLWQRWRCWSKPKATNPTHEKLAQNGQNGPFYPRPLKYRPKWIFLPMFLTSRPKWLFKHNSLEQVRRLRDTTFGWVGKHIVLVLKPTNVIVAQSYSPAHEQLSNKRPERPFLPTVLT